jgi:putative pyruvate formate lyase activating enzyme
MIKIIEEEFGSEFFEILTRCILCGKQCKVDRLSGEIGICTGGLLPKIYRYCIHYGEEPAISGTKGSGTVFFSGCSLKCVYCQNHSWSQGGDGHEIEIKDLALIFLNLQDDGAHNINLVTPTHFVPQIIQALIIAKSLSLNIPIVYNTSGYESLNALKMLKGYVDIYLVDVKYSDDIAAKKYSDVSNYSKINEAALKEMIDQVGQLKLDKDGISQKGILIRHLVIPNHIKSSLLALKLIKRICGTDTYISLMSQYIPLHNAKNFSEINIKVDKEDYQIVIDYFLELGFSNGWIQEISNDINEEFIGENMQPNI